MDNFALWVLSFLCLFPLLLSIFSIFIKFFPLNQMMYASLGLSLLATLLLLWNGEGTLSTPLSFMGEPISLSLSTTALLMCLVLLGILGVLLHLNRVKNNRALTHFDFLILNFSLSFGFLAFFSNQFMIRYIALELVGLLAAASLCQPLTSEAFKRFGNVFLMLRIGDVCLLSSILLILPHSGTLTIPDMISAAGAMPLAQRSWVILGFVLAVMVKMAVFPFSGWQRLAKGTADSPAFWTAGFLFPALGMYLLYRVYPVIESAPLFQVALPLLAAGLILAQMAIGYFNQHTYERLVHLGSLLNSFVLLMAAHTTGHVLRYYFLGLLLQRLVMYLQTKGTLPQKGRALALFPVVLNLAILIPQLAQFPIWLAGIWVTLTVMTFLWDRQLSNRDLPPEATKAPIATDWRQPVTALAEGLYQHLEVDLFSNGVERLAGAFNSLAGGVYQLLELNLFSDGLAHLTKAFTNLAGWVQNSIELGFDKAWAGLGKLLTAISAGVLNGFNIGADEKAVDVAEDVMQSIDKHEQDIQSRSLQQDLIWIPILMLVILGFLFISRGG